MSNPSNILNINPDTLSPLERSKYKRKKRIKKPVGVVQEDCQYKYCMKCPLNKCEKNE